MADLIQNVKDGVIQQTNSSKSSSSSTSSTSKSSGNNLGKDAFLKLLVTQMQYQDPLNPSSNTEYVAQLATYSQLEELQNLSSTATNSQAFGLVGKNVVIKTDSSSTEKETYINGTVDFVNMSGGKAQLSVNGKLYSIDNLDTVIDDTYLKEKNLPSVTQTALKYDASNPKNQTFDVVLGSGDTVADDVAIAIDGTVVDTSLTDVKNGKVTIDQSAFAKLKNGTYKITVGFNDSLYTTVKDKVTLQVQNSTVTDTTTTGTTATDTGTTGTQSSTDTTASGSTTQA